MRRANERRAEIDLTPLPEGLTPHSMRRTFASILVALGQDPLTIADQMGHGQAGFTLRVYAQVMRRGDEERDALRALVGAGSLDREPSRVEDRGIAARIS